MLRFDKFADYQSDLLKCLKGREPGIEPNPLEHINPDFYIFNPILEVPLEKIDNMPSSAPTTKEGLETFTKSGQEPCEGAFHGVRFGRKVDIPIAVTANGDGTFSIMDGFHRAVQAFVNEDKTIWAFVEDGVGPSLRNIFNSVKDLKNKKA